MSTRRYGDQIGRAELSGLPQQPHATGSRAANMTDFRVGYDFGYGDGQVGEYQPEKHRAAHATPDRAARYFDTVAVDTVRWFPPHPQKHGAFFHVEPDSPESTGGSVEFQDADELDAFIAWLRERRIEAFGDA